jgi:hypothetical protein
MAVHSKLTVVKLDTAAGALTDISTYVRECSMPRELDLLDVTTFGATSKQYLTGFADGTVTLSGPWTRAQDQMFTALFDAFRAGTLASASFEYHPEGTDSGDVKHTCEVVMTNYEPGSTVEEEVEFSAEFQITGAITSGTN